MVLIRIDGYDVDALLSGKSRDERTLRRMANDTFALAQGEAFVTLFCRMWGYDRFLYDPAAEYDVVIDTDTHLVYTPK